MLFLQTGADVRKLRLELGLTQKEFSKLLGLKNRSTISKLEQQKTLTDKKKLQISKVLEKHFVTKEGNYANLSSLETAILKIKKGDYKKLTKYEVIIVRDTLKDIRDCLNALFK